MHVEDSRIQTVEGNGTHAGTLSARIMGMPGPPIPTPPREWSVQTTLRTGETVLIRPIQADDRASLDSFHEGLSSRTVYLRFFSAHPHLTGADLDYFTRVDGVNRVALVAEVDRAIVGVGRFDLVDAGTAEAAFVVTDRMQGRGIGALLLQRLMVIARGLGVEEFIAEVLPANMRMLEMFRHSGRPVTERIVEDVVEVKFPILEA